MIDEKLDLFRNYYSKELYEILTKMAVVDINKRIDIVNLNNMFKIFN